MWVEGPQSEVNAPKAAGTVAVDVLSGADHLDGVGNSEPAVELREQGAASADLLRGASARTADVGEGAVRVALGGVVVRNETGKLAERGAEVKVESVGVMAGVLAEEGAGGRVDGLVDEVSADGRTEAVGEMAAEPIAVGEPKGGGEVITLHGEEEELGPDRLVPSDNAGAGKLMVRGELVGRGEGSAAIAADLERNGAVKGTRRDSARRVIGVVDEQAAEPEAGLGVMSAEGREEKAVVPERDGSMAAGAEEVNQ